MSDILIRGMKMPATCWNCKLKVGFSACGLVTDHKDGGFFYRVHNGNSRPDWCPLVPLPEKHGRLIDADALQAKFEMMENASVEHGRAFSFSFKDCGEKCAEWWTVQDALSREPTIIDAEGGGEDG